MSIKDKMTMDERRKHLRKMQERYLQAESKRKRGFSIGLAQPPRSRSIDVLKEQLLGSLSRAK